jgi:hypothetical protein
MEHFVTVLGGLCVMMAIQYWVHRRKLRRMREEG